MNNYDKLNKFLNEAKNFLGKNLTCSDSKFEAWNNSLLRFIKNNYDEDTLNSFKTRSYSLSVWTFSTPDTAFIKAFEDDIKTTIEELSILIEEESEKYCNDNSKNDNKLANLLNIFDKFHIICRQLKKRHDSRETLIIKDEYDVQDLLHSLLLLYFDDVRAEEWNPSYAGSSSRQDFLLKKEKIVIEVKKTRSGLKDKQIGEQLLIDINRYKVHPDCKTLICFVYDPEEEILNPKGIEEDLTNVFDGVNVITIICQR